LNAVTEQQDWFDTFGFASCFMFILLFLLLMFNPINVCHLHQAFMQDLEVGGVTEGLGFSYTCVRGAGGVI
jgi:hypothetical protein